MATQKKSTLKIGALNIGVRLEVAADKDESGFRTVCTGVDAHHDPIRVKTNVDCPECGNRQSSVWGYEGRAKEIDGSLILVTADEMKQAAGAPIKDLTLAFHSRDEVYTNTLASDSVQNVYPDKGFEKAYRGLVEALTARPHLVACTIWAPATKNALWVLDVVDGRLVTSKRCWPEDVRPVEQIPTAELSEAELNMFGVFIDGSVSDFSLDVYKDARREGVKTLLSERGVSYDAAESGTGSLGSDLLSTLQASVDALRSPSTKTTVRKVAAKKTVAKKAVTKKTAAKRTPAKKAVAKSGEAA